VRSTLLRGGISLTFGQLGPIFGGSLSRPSERFPAFFGNNEFLKTHPYFLPCAVPATFSALAWLVTFLFLKETVQSPLSLSRLLRFKEGEATLEPRNVDRSPEPSDAEPQKPSESNKPIPLRSLLTWPVIVAAGNYACLSLVDIALRAIQPLFFSTPIELGGLGLPPSTIGNILAIYGIANGLFQVLFFAKIHDYWGSKRIFIFGIASAIPAFGAFPLISHLARSHGLGYTVWAVVALQTVISIGLNLSYGKQFRAQSVYAPPNCWVTGAIFIFIAAASPNRASLGATNGLSQVRLRLFELGSPGDE